MAENISNDQIEYHFTVSDNEQGARLDVILAQHLPDYSRARLQTWIRQGHVLINGQTCQPKDKLKPNQTINICATTTIATTAKPQNISLDIIYEDSALIIINKPVGLVVHPGAGNPDGTLLNALLHHHPQLGQLPRAGIIHRLDKDTSGLLVVPKTLKSHHNLSQQLQEKTMARHYLALVSGTLIAGGTINAAIGRHHIHRTHMTVKDSGKPAITHYRIHERFKNHTLLKVMLETGRTHQIRVHCQHINHPIIGDPTYHNRHKFPKNAHPDLVTSLQEYQHQALHAYQLQIIHPDDNQPHQWTAPIPNQFAQLINTVRKHDKHEHTYS